jgi:2-dehydro-3-deoxygalactonokinase
VANVAPESFLISCDWGTSAFRLRLVRPGPTPEVVAERSTLDGILAIQPAGAEGFERHLAAEIERLFGAAGLAPEPAPVYLSGMVTSSVGWKELHYALLPFPLDGSRAVVARAALDLPHGSHPLLFISGLRSEDDVLRGEETELIGIFGHPGVQAFADSCVAILPGTHSKAVVVARREIVAFRTYMTGELFSVLGRSSILSRSIDPSVPGDPDDPAFERGVRRGCEEGLIESLFTVRTGPLLAGVPSGANARYLSGMLIGAEAASIARRHPASCPILVAGGAALQALYARAFELVGAGARTHAAPPEVTGLAAVRGHCILRDRPPEPNPP